MTNRQAWIVIAVVATLAVCLLVVVGVLVANQPHGPLRKDEKSGAALVRSGGQALLPI